jgi:hypothetical protein
VYALHSYMIELSFITDPPFECPDKEVSDAAFVKASRTIDDRDAMEEYVACGLLPLSTSFGLGEVVDREVNVSKLLIPMSDLLVAGLPEETNG